MIIFGGRIKMSQDYKKIILTTTLWTISCIIVLSAVFICVMVFAFPKNLGDFFYSLGGNNLASSLYMKEYNRSNNIYYCYKSLNIEIKLNNSSKIIRLYEIFEEDKEHTEFLKQLKERNEKLELNLLEKSTILNDYNYLTNRYVKALIKIGEENKAYAKALNSFKDYKTFDFKNQGIYAFSELIAKEGFIDYNAKPAGYEDTMLKAIKEYFGIITNLFNEHKETSDSLEKAYLISLGNRIIQVGHDINTACNEDETLVANNNQIMIEVNNVIKGLL